MRWICLTISAVFSNTKSVVSIIELERLRLKQRSLELERLEDPMPMLPSTKKLSRYRKSTTSSVRK